MKKYITLVGNSAILNPMNKHDKLLVIDPKFINQWRVFN